MPSFTLKFARLVRLDDRPSGLTVDLSFIKTLQGEEASSPSTAGFARHPPPTSAGLFLPATPTLRTAREPAPTRPQAASPIFRAALVQTSAALRPFHSALLRYKGGETPRLAVATPRLRQVAFGIWFQMPRISAKNKGATTMTTKKHNAGFQTLALTDIHESITNPRRTFDESKLAELADYVARHIIGVLCC
jgi:hypothetical protein